MSAASAGTPRTRRVRRPATAWERALLGAVRTVARRWLALFLVASFVFTTLPLAAPLLARAGHDAPSAAIYAVYRVACHQLPHRSWFIGGEAAAYDWPTVRPHTGVAAGASPYLAIHTPLRHEALGYQMAFCQRDTAIHGALFLTALAITWAGRRRPVRPLPLRFYLLMLVPIGLDGVTQLVGLRESTPLLRTLTGAVFGVATALLVIPQLDLGMRELAEMTPEPD